jgi:GNAT superfamily N-acetyltransferase
LNVTTHGIVPMTSQHIPAVVKAHVASFPGYILSFLGPRFLSLYYSGVHSAPEGISFVYLNAAGVPVGFVVGASNPRGFFSKLLKRDWLRFSLASVGAIFSRPSVLTRIARLLFHPEDHPVGADVACLLYIGILPELQGTGIGQVLLKAFLHEALTRGCRRVVLSAYRDNNEAVNSFYQKMGFRIEQQWVTPEGHCMNEYWIDLVEKNDRHA